MRDVPAFEARNRLTSLITEAEAGAAIPIRAAVFLSCGWCRSRRLKTARERTAPPILYGHSAQR
jgi:hypothetical protein